MSQNQRTYLIKLIEENRKSAQNALYYLSPTDVMEMTAARKPSQILKTALDAFAICFNLNMNPLNYIQELQIIRGIAIPFWLDSFDQTKVILNFMKFNILRQMKEFDLNSLNGETMELLEPFVVEGQKWFNQRTFNRSSKTLGKLCEWVYLLFEWYVLKVQIQKLQKQQEEMLPINQDDMKEPMIE